jgi:hypothetical protein
MDTLHWTTEFLLRKGLDPQLVQWIALIVDLLILLLISLLADFFARRIILSVIHGAVKRTKATWDDYFYDQKVFRNIAHLVPGRDRLRKSSHRLLRYPSHHSRFRKAGGSLHSYSLCEFSE